MSSLPSSPALKSYPSKATTRPAEAGKAALLVGTEQHFDQLDDWRAISICCVLAAHLLPLGPKSLNLNETVGAVGMSVFFTLSGFLITLFLIRSPQVRPFLIRRMCRILPLAWTYEILMLLLVGGGLGAWAANLLFTLNYDHQYINNTNGHLWSVCVEIHFYLFVALLVAGFGQRSLLFLPLLCLVVTANRMVVGARISIMTHLRVDEILAGACVALLVAGRINARWKWPMVYVPGWVWAILLFLSANPLSQQLQYFRPYFGALLVGSTLLRNQAGFTPFFVRPTLKYLATISYALYIIHAYFTIGWFGEGNTLTKYLVKRPVGITLTFILAHLSTFHWEAHWIALGKRLTSKSVPKGLPPSLEIKVCPDSPDSRMNSEQPNQSIADSLTCPR